MQRSTIAILADVLGADATKGGRSAASQYNISFAPTDCVTAKSDSQRLARSAELSYGYKNKERWRYVSGRNFALFAAFFVKSCLFHRLGLKAPGRGHAHVHSSVHSHLSHAHFFLHEKQREHNGRHDGEHYEHGDREQYYHQFRE
jgi:hypothetical protein